MKKTAVILLLAGLSAGLLAGAEAPRERTVQFSLLSI